MLEELDHFRESSIKFSLLSADYGRQEIFFSCPSQIFIKQNINELINSGIHFLSNDCKNFKDSCPKSVHKKNYETSKISPHWQKQKQNFQTDL